MSDAVGNRTEKLDASGYGQLYSYADNNRLVETSTRDATGDTVVGDYTYDGRGQRAVKVAGGVTTHYIYGPSGELLGEYVVGLDENRKEYVYLNGQPIAVYAYQTVTTQPSAQELTLDNGDPGTSSSGSWQTKSDAQQYGSGYEYANQASGRTYRWTATPPGGPYDVYAWWVEGNHWSDTVTYTIRYGSGETDIVVKSHGSGGGQWQYLGTYSSVDGQDYVEVSSSSNKFSADAIRWVHTPDPIVAVTEGTYCIQTS